VLVDTRLLGHPLQERLDVIGGGHR
jgi:hypothetical protein